MGTADAPGAWRLDLTLVRGADVDWSIRVRALPAADDGACLASVHLNEVEADPPGPDRGHTWVELVNPGPWPVDVSDWRVTTPDDGLGQPVANGTTLAAGARLVVNLDQGPELDPAGHVVQLRDVVGTLLDATPLLADPNDDTRTNQRVPEVEGAWVLAEGTPGAAPG